MTRCVNSKWSQDDDAYGYYGEMMGGFGWVRILLVLAVVIAVVVWARARDSGRAITRLN